MTRDPNVIAPAELVKIGYASLLFSTGATCPGCGQFVKVLYTNPACPEPRCRNCFGDAQGKVKP